VTGGFDLAEVLTAVERPVVRPAVAVPLPAQPEVLLAARRSRDRRRRARESARQRPARPRRCCTILFRARRPFLLRKPA